MMAFQTAQHDEETRSQTIIRYTQMYMRNTGTSMPTMASLIAEEYLNSTKQSHRMVKFHSGGDAHADMRANAQVIRRFIEGEHRLPCDLEESWVRALPDPYRTQLIGQLNARYGLLAVRMPQHIQEAHASGLARLMKDTGEAAEVVAQMLGNNKFGPEDMGRYNDAMRELDDVIVAAIELKNRIHNGVTGAKTGCPSVMH